MMRVGSFELTIRDLHGTTRHETAEGYVPLRHGEQYCVGLRNHGAGRCNLEIRIDGTSVGRFQVAPYADATLERPQDGDGRFTFFAADTDEAKAVGAGAVAPMSRGLVEVTFTPEVVWPTVLDAMWFGPQVKATYWHDVYRYTSLCSSEGLERSAGFGAGVTGQTGHSDQRFGAARPITEDRARETVITLRLVLDRQDACCRPRPLPGRRCNAVPPPVG